MRNFEHEVYKSVVNGFDLVDINYSKEFNSDFMPYVSKEISSQMKTNAILVVFSPDGS